MKKRKLFFIAIAATAVMLIMAACSGSFVDPGALNNGSGIVGGGASFPNYPNDGDDDDGNGGGKPPTKPDCGSYQKDYDAAKSSVEAWRKSVADDEKYYNSLGNSSRDEFLKEAAKANLNQSRMYLQTAQSNLSSVQQAAKDAGCSVR